jgi:hypothetical protein
VGLPGLTLKGGGSDVSARSNARLGLAGRLALVLAIDAGLSLRVAAAAFSVSPTMAHRWWHRWLDGDRRSESLLDHSSRPRYSPRLLAPELEDQICVST